jgi:protoporphyrinogen oxidase
LLNALTNALSIGRQPSSGEADRRVATLVTTFRYPRRGPGMLWDACAQRVRALGGSVELGRRVVAIERRRRGWRLVHEGPDGARWELDATHVISSAPLGELVAMVQPRLDAAAFEAASGLRHRDFLTVALIVDRSCSFPAQWLYVHDPRVQVGRIQNFLMWSDEMVPDQDTTCLGLEYFCTAGDDTWRLSDERLVGLGSQELATLGLARPEQVRDGTVVRQRQAYPIYDAGYAERVAVIRRSLEARCPDLWTVGRNGMHRYNNQDHSMVTALLTVENILAGTRRFDPWRVNEDAVYHEHGDPGSQPLSPVR